MPSKKPKTKKNQTSVQQRRTEKRADLTHLPPTRKAGPAHFCSAWLRPAGCSSAHKEKQKKINLSISQPLSFSRPARDYYDFTNTNITCVHLEQTVTFALRSFSRLCAKQRERKNV